MGTKPKQDPEKIRSIIEETIRQYQKHLPEGTKVEIEYDSKYDLFEVNLWLRPKGNERELCTQVAAVAVLLSYYDGGYYECYGYGGIHCRVVIWSYKFRENLFRTYEDALKEAKAYCDKYYAEVERRLREVEEEKERKRREYEEWRRRRLGDCYAERLDYSVAELYFATIGESVLGVDELKPGDKLLIDLNVFSDPCFVKKVGDEIYVDGYIPLIDRYCRCEKSGHKDYVVIRLPLYIHGRLPKKPDAPPPPDDYNELLQYLYVYTIWKHIIAEYKGDGRLEIVGHGKDDYDYYLAQFIYDAHTTIASFRIDGVEGAVWYSIYEHDGYGIYSIAEGGSRTLSDAGADLSPCCLDIAELVALLLIKRGEEAKVRFYTTTSYEEERYEAVISAKEYPPAVKVRRIEKKKKECCSC
jgi:hypothetical protein